jgi:glutathione S-transferase
MTIADGRVLADSLDIARWADGQGDGPRLFPADHEAAITRLVALSERGLAAGRNLTLARMLHDEDALSELVPRPLRNRFGGVGVGVARIGVARTLRKYAVTGTTPEAHRKALTDVLDEVRAALSKAPTPAEGAPRTLLGALTFADVAVAQVVLNVEPPTSGFRMGKGSRRCFSEPGLREEYADLVTWRDDLYRTSRGA